MQMREKDEKRRSLLWKIVMGTSTAVIVLLIGYFIANSVFGNPLEGKWFAEDKGYYLEIEDDNEMTVEGVFDGQEMEIDLIYTLDKKQKTITIKAGAGEYRNISSAWTTEETIDAPNRTSVTLSYSLGHNTLTLSDREYGVEFVFTSK